MVNGRLPKRVARRARAGIGCHADARLRPHLRHRLLQILIKCRLFEICEKTPLIHVEYGQKARGAENQCFKPRW
jgi:hypothetical protein